MMEDLDWESFEGAFKSQAHGTKTCLTKFIHGWLPCDKRRKLINDGNDECPHCGLKENNEHILVCRHPCSFYNQGIRLTALIREARIVAVKHQEQLGGSKMTLRGYLSMKWQHMVSQATSLLAVQTQDPGSRWACMAIS